MASLSAPPIQEVHFHGLSGIFGANRFCASAWRPTLKVPTADAMTDLCRHIIEAPTFELPPTAPLHDDHTVCYKNRRTTLGSLPAFIQSL